MNYANADGQRYDLHLNESSHLRNAQILTLMRTIVQSETPEEARANSSQIEEALAASTPAAILQLHDIGSVLRRFADQRIAAAGGLEEVIDAAVLSGELLVVDPDAPPRIATDEQALQDAQEATDE